MILEKILADVAFENVRQGIDTETRLLEMIDSALQIIGRIEARVSALEKRLDTPDPKP